jgi:hypothetical protein
MHFVLEGTLADLALAWGLSNKNSDHQHVSQVASV